MDIDLKHLKESSLEQLDLSDNQISGSLGAELCVGSKPKLKQLYLRSNHLTSIAFGNMEQCPLEELDVAMNPIQTMDFSGIGQSKLEFLNLELMPSERYPLNRQIVEGVSYHYLMGIANSFWQSSSRCILTMILSSAPSE